MKIFLFAIGARDRASSRLRIWDHVEWLRAQGHDVRVDSLVPPGTKSLSPRVIARILTRLPGWILNFLRADAIMLQETLLLWPLMALRNIGKRRRVVFDFSDPVDRHATGVKGAIRRLAFGVTIRSADRVVVENRAYLESLRERATSLAHFYGPVDVPRYREARATGSKGAANGRSDRVVRIGWTGSPGTYAFIRPLMPIIDDLARDHPIEVILIGAGTIDHVFHNATLTLIPWDEQTEFEIVPCFDLGLFRLEDTEDALWRGAGKLFIYMAAGVPFIANDRGIACDLMAESGLGFAVRTENDWKDVLRRALKDPSARDRMAEACADFAASRLSYDVYRQKMMAELRIGA